MLSFILVPGLIGGLLFALFLRRVRVQDPPARLRLEPPSPGLINMARIRVDGFGGLGLFGMAATVAVFVPRIRAEMSLALVLGLVFAVVLILARRRRGPLTSSSDHPGAHVMFELEDDRSRGRTPTGGGGNGPSGARRALVTVHPR